MLYSPIYNNSTRLTGPRNFGAAQRQKRKEAEEEDALLQGQRRLGHKEDRDGHHDEPGLPYLVFSCLRKQYNKNGQQGGQADQSCSHQRLNELVVKIESQKTADMPVRAIGRISDIHIDRKSVV